MEKTDLRRRVFDVLRKTPQTHFRAVENEVRRAEEAYERRDVLALNEVLWELLVQGVLAPGKNSLNPDLPFVHVTAYGARCLEEETILAHDPDRYAERLSERTGGRIAPIVLESAREGLFSFLDGRFPAAVLLLAHAGEALLDELAAALIDSGQRAGRGTKRVEAARRTPVKLPTVARLALARRDPPEEIGDDAESQLAGIRALIRLARSDAGDPLLPNVDRDRAHAEFLLFPGRCRFVYHVVGWLERASNA